MKNIFLSIIAVAMFSVACNETEYPENEIVVQTENSTDAKIFVSQDGSQEIGISYFASGDVATVKLSIKGEAEKVLNPKLEAQENGGVSFANEHYEWQLSESGAEGVLLKDGKPMKYSLKAEGE